LQKRSAMLRAELDPFYTRYAESDNADVIVRCRRAGDADYIFVINDRRERGDYVGQHGKVMERGVPSRARVTVRRAGGVIYDPLKHEEVQAERGPSGSSFNVALGPGEGRLYMIVPSRIGAFEITAPATVRRKNSLHVALRLRDQNSKAVEGVPPVKLDIVDPEGRLAEFSGHYAAAKGELGVVLDIAGNDVPGEWLIRATELASGMRAETRFTVGP